MGKYLKKKKRRQLRSRESLNIITWRSSKILIVFQEMIGVIITEMLQYSKKRDAWKLFAAQCMQHLKCTWAMGEFFKPPLYCLQAVAEASHF